MQHRHTHPHSHSHSHSHGVSSVLLRSRVRGCLCFLLGVAATLMLTPSLLSLSRPSTSSLASLSSDTQGSLSSHHAVRGSAPDVPPSADRGFVSRLELEQVAHHLSANGTLLMTVCNQGYLDFLENWMFFAAKLRLDKHMLVVAEDVVTWDKVNQNWPGQTVRLRVPELEKVDDKTLASLGLEGTAHSHTGGSESEFNSPRFKKMMYRRVFYVRELLYARVNVLLMDTDIVLLRNPLPFLQPQQHQVPGDETAGANKSAVDSGQSKEFDMMGVLDEPDWKGFWRLRPYALPRNATLRFLKEANVCGGFLFFRCTPATWVLLDLLAMKLFRATKHTGKENEQTYLAQVMWEGLQLRPPVRIGILPQQLFEPGWLYFTDHKYEWWRKMLRRTTKESPVLVHNNWVLGKAAKIRRFVSKGLWALGTPPPQQQHSSIAHSPTSSHRSST